MKKCNKCGIDKELSFFYLKKDGKPKTSFCKECYCATYKTSKEKNRKYYDDNKEMFKENYKKYTETNDRSEYLKKYREENRDAILKKNKEFRDNNKELVKLRKKAYYQKLTGLHNNNITYAKII